MTPSVSVIIPSYNSCRTILQTLDSLALSRESLLKEIIVADSSDDGQTRRLLETYPSEKLRLVRLPEKTMPAAARNTGAREASGDILAFIDSDAYAAQDWLENIRKAYEDGHRVGGGSIGLPPFQKRNGLAVAQYFLQFNQHLPLGGRRTDNYVASCNLFCGKELFGLVKGFPEVRAAEDVLFGLKAGKKSPVLFDPSIQVYHIFREDMGAYLANQRMLGKYILVYRRAALGRWIYRGVTPAALCPLFVIYKFLKLSVKVLKTARPGLLLPFFASLPLLLLGLIYWGAGFFNACFEKSHGEYDVIREYT